MIPFNHYDAICSETNSKTSNDAKQKYRYRERWRVNKRHIEGDNITQYKQPFNI